MHMLIFRHDRPLGLGRALYVRQSEKCYLPKIEYLGLKIRFKPIPKSILQKLRMSTFYIQAFKLINLSQGNLARGWTDSIAVCGKMFVVCPNGDGSIFNMIGSRGEKWRIVKRFTNSFKNRFYRRSFWPLHFIKKL